ncbi:MAG TPA: helix-turn-helix domain-containing protein [Syntrophorhabdaceae bacterium]|nr:helix-turn-helix domain-containing protein [Syntrophorhabdaceae bacterium]HQM80772.1 helix-turn-helix domain-containing protein [Syntrophorhabdaceae bacterium]
MAGFAQRGYKNFTGEIYRKMKLLTVDDVARILQAKPSTIYAWSEQGLIPSIKIHGLRRFIEDEVLSWLKDLHQNNPQRYNVDIQTRSLKKGGRK